MFEPSAHERGDRNPSSSIDSPQNTAYRHCRPLAPVEFGLSSLVSMATQPTHYVCLLAPSHRNTYTNIGSNPTRANILCLLHSLATNPAIGCGDPIIIYFAGHGTCYLWTEEDADIELEEEHDAEHLQNFVEALCPVDRNTFDVSGSLVTDITDRELNATLTQIYSTKGNQITFIFWTAATLAASCEEWAEKPAWFPQ
ncbi:uncharacterized protein ARMOST_20996 [Armillaria ostoyae]|uniref:Metacaspase n=1 Tax=Armillaria ostoyae TaxID=47428 RepID=A0A284S900_ARMOS|nr:uncharacterized protein ARMOST_20996 [Armillaria ostoyae]